MWVELGDLLQLTATLDAFGHVAWSRGQATRALRLTSYAESLRRQQGVRMNPDASAWLQRWLPLANSTRQDTIHSGPADDMVTLQQAVSYAFPGAESASSSVNIFTRIAGRHDLTVRELEVVSLIAQGRTDREIARQLTVSERTVHSHVRSVFGKVGVRGRAGIAAWAVREGVDQFAQRDEHRVSTGLRPPNGSARSTTPHEPYRPH